MILRLLHGRKHPSEELDDWGPDGPSLHVEWLHITYMCTIRIGLPGISEEFWLDDWKPGVQDGTIVEDLFYYDGMFYGDWELLDGDGGEPFAAEKALFRKAQTL
jgi:hypothetical protein